MVNTVVDYSNMFSKIISTSKHNLTETYRLLYPVLHSINHKVHYRPSLSWLEKRCRTTEGLILCLDITEEIQTKKPIPRSCYSSLGSHTV